MQRNPSVLACVCGLFVVAVCCITYVAFYKSTHVTAALHPGSPQN